MAQFRHAAHISGCVGPSSPHIDGGRCAGQRPISAKEPDQPVRSERKGVKQTEERGRLHGPESISP